jgi:hypothetical protein
MAKPPAVSDAVLVAAFDPWAESVGELIHRATADSILLRLNHAEPDCGWDASVAAMRLGILVIGEQSVPAGAAETVGGVETSGGTGFARTKATPESVRAVLEAKWVPRRCSLACW